MDDISKGLLFCEMLIGSNAVTTWSIIRQNPSENPEKEAVIKVVIDAYINGFFNVGDVSLVKKGFHPDSDVYILSKGTLMKVPVYSYIERMGENFRPLHEGTTYEFTHVHVTGSAGMAVVEIFQEDRHIYTDYIAIYKFAEGWKIVIKIYYQYPRNDSGL